jgi:hypothetical protein
LLVSGGIAELCVNRGVLDIGVPQPVFHEGKISAGVSETPGCPGDVPTQQTCGIKRTASEEGEDGVWKSRTT